MPEASQPSIESLSAPAEGLSVCAVVPAHNEAGRIGAVLTTLAASPEVDAVIVVDDGSTDATLAEASAHIAAQGKQAKVTVIRQSPNRGKGAAMLSGAAQAENFDVLLFFDADLVGLTPAHVRDILAPVTSGAAVMALGVFRGGRGATTLAQKIAPNISGQRAIRRDLFLSIPGLGASGYGVELAITNHVLSHGLPMVQVVLQDVTHPMKEEKLGFVRGFGSRLRMYYQMLPQIFRRVFGRRG
ncbi:MAG: glycosyltransferase family 2 protein [Armatimonadetes bacterium]|nr:glycosyltransferase family 2 protein [Armatimonadota bacterium]